MSVPAALFMAPLLHCCCCFLIRPRSNSNQGLAGQPRSWLINPTHEFNTLLPSCFSGIQIVHNQPPWPTAWWSHSWNSPHTTWPRPSLQTCSYLRAFTLTLRNPSVLSAFLPLLSSPRHKRDPCACLSLCWELSFKWQLKFCFMSRCPNQWGPRCVSHTTSAPRGSSGAIPLVAHRSVCLSLSCFYLSCEFLEERINGWCALSSPMPNNFPC